MRRTFLFFAVASAIPALFAACGGGRTEVSVAENDTVGSTAAGAGGRGGAGGTEIGRGGSNATGGSGPIVTGGAGGTGGGGGSGPIGKGGTGGTGGAGGGGGSGPIGKGGTGGSGGSGGTGGGGGSGPIGKGGTGGGGGSGPIGKGGTGGSGGSNTDPPIDVFDAGIPLPDSGPVGECVSCLEQNCKSSINGCVNDPSCTGGIQCALTTCIGGGGGAGGPGFPPGGGGGGFDFQCLLGCFDGDLGAVLTAVQAFQCVTGTCGETCGGALGGIGGGGGPFGGLGGGGTPLGGGGGMTPPNPGNAPTPQDSTPRIDGVRVPMPEEVPGFPAFQKALQRPARPAAAAAKLRLVGKRARFRARGGARASSLPTGRARVFRFGRGGPAGRSVIATPCPTDFAAGKSSEIGQELLARKMLCVWVSGGFHPPRKGTHGPSRHRRFDPHADPRRSCEASPPAR